MKKVFKIAEIRELDRKLANEEISYTRMVEIINEKANEHLQKCLNDVLDDALIKKKIKQPNSNTITQYIIKYLND